MYGEFRRGISVLFIVCRPTMSTRNVNMGSCNHGHTNIMFIDCNQ